MITPDYFIRFEFDAMVIKLKKEARFWEHNGNRNDYIIAFDMSNLVH